MSQADMERAIASATGESLRTIRRRGFSIMDPREVDFDPEPNDLPAQMVDWDHRQEAAARRME
ncbi:MAG TPA: hypothetical protein VL069_13240 [Opitutus sp.]|nr:hypothetical protein [Opitutus sp.]